MPSSALARKKLSAEIALAKIDDTLRNGDPDAPPAYTLILGAGASFGVVPTAKEMLGFPCDGKVHPKCIPIWLTQQSNRTREFTDAEGVECSRDFWQRFVERNSWNRKYQSLALNAEGFPELMAISAAYQAVFDTGCVGGLDSPERHREYLRAVTLAADPGNMQLNATHFFLASLLSLQSRVGETGSDNKLLYTGKREFARTIFTTNFDPLLQTSFQLFQLLYYMTDRPEILSADALQTDHHPVIHFFYAHGSVHRPFLANTDEQIEFLKKQNARDLAAYLGSHGVIVLGYSGWDDCLLEALNQTRTFSNNLYWLVKSEASVTESVSTFLTTHPNAYLVEIGDGGRFMAELHRRLCPGAPNTELLYDPIRPLLRQLKRVNLKGIEVVREGSMCDKETIGPDERPTNVEDIRQQVLARLGDVEKRFTDIPDGNVTIGERLRQADLAFSNEDWNKAIELYQLVVNSPGVPTDVVAQSRLDLGICYAHTNTEMAIKEYSAVVDLPDAPIELSLTARIHRAICALDAGEMQNAIDDCDIAIRSNASIVLVGWARIVRALIYQDQGKHDDVITEATTIISTPEFDGKSIARAMLIRAKSYQAKMDFKNAVADLLKVIDHDAATAVQVAQARDLLEKCEDKHGYSEASFYVNPNGPPPQKS